MCLCPSSAHQSSTVKRTIHSLIVHISMYTIARTKGIVSFAEVDENSIGPKAVRLYWPVLTDFWRSVELAEIPIEICTVGALTALPDNIVGCSWCSAGLAVYSFVHCCAQVTYKRIWAKITVDVAQKSFHIPLFHFRHFSFKRTCKHPHQT